MENGLCDFVIAGSFIWRAPDSDFQASTAANELDLRFPL